jgi:hypothetical protein
VEREERWDSEKADCASSERFEVVAVEVHEFRAAAVARNIRERGREKKARDNRRGQAPPESPCA